MKYILTFTCLIFIIQAKGQLLDNFWVFTNSDSLFFIDFRDNPPSITKKDKLLDFYTAKSTYCDDEGNLLYYTNCIKINNQIDSVLENGDNLNPGIYSDENIIPAFNAGFFIPAPKDTNHCYFIYMHPEHNPPLLTKVYYALIDKNANNGLGKVIEKNTPLLTGGLNSNFNHAGAVRHANGRDWWIIVPNRMEPKYYRILLSPEGFSVLDTQEIGYKTATDDPYYYAFGKSLFVQNGTKFIEFEPKTGIFQLYDFDRCTGILDNPIQIQTPHTLNFPYITLEGYAISPSGQMLYASYASGLTGPAVEIKQYDLNAQDILASEKLIWSCNKPSQWECSAGQMLLAPNGKIYIQALIDTVAYHVIHHPDNDITNCGFEYGGLRFPSKYPQSAMPYLPNYRLGPIDGSVCDTLGIDNHPLAGFNWEVADSLNPLLIGFYDNSFYEPTDWFWNFAGTGTSSEVNPVHEFPSPGTYEVCLTVSNQFDSDTFCQNVRVDSLPTATSDLDRFSQEFFRVSPNPTNGISTVQYHLPEHQTGELWVIDIAGKQVASYQLTSESTTIQLPPLPSGIYFVRVSINGRILQTEKLVKN